MKTRTQASLLLAMFSVLGASCAAHHDDADTDGDPSCAGGKCDGTNQSCSMTITDDTIALTLPLQHGIRLDPVLAAQVQEIVSVARSSASQFASWAVAPVYQADRVSVVIKAPSAIATAWRAGQVTTGTAALDNVVGALPGVQISPESSTGELGQTPFLLTFSEGVNVFALATALQTTPEVLKVIPHPTGATGPTTQVWAQGDVWSVGFVDSSGGAMHTVTVDRCGAVNATPGSCTTGLSDDAVRLALRSQGGQADFYPQLGHGERMFAEQLDMAMADELQTVIDQARALDPAFASIHAMSSLAQSPARQVDLTSVVVVPTADVAQAWTTGATSTGKADLDSALSALGMTSVEAIGSEFYLRFSSRMNTAVLASHLSGLAGVTSADINPMAGDGDDITLDRVDSGWMVTFIHGYGDCLDGCLHHDVVGKVLVDCCGATKQ